MSITRMCTTALMTAPTSHANAARPPRWLIGLQGRAREYAYAIAVALLALVVGMAVPGTAPSSDEAYAPLAIAVMVGLLLTVRLVPNRTAGAMVLIPAVIFDARFGLAALPAIAWAGIVANLLRGLRGPRLISTAAHLVLAYAVAALAAHGLSALPGWFVFAVVFAFARVALWHIGARLDSAPAHAQAEKPEVLLLLPLAPIALLPLVAGERLGDGALLLAVAALLGLLFVVREAANLSTARAEMESERDRLVQANQLQDDLIHLITHDLRNPLTLVLSYSQLVRRAAVDENSLRIPGYVDQIEKAGRSIERLIENLLQLSKLERPEAFPPPEPVDVGRVISLVVAELSPLATQKHQTVRVESGDDIEMVMAVPLLLREAVSNLVTNAVKYTPEGGDITVWTEHGADARTVLIGVRDTGIGLTEDDQARLFTKFFRSSDPRVQRERGSGLGLALTHTMIVRMGGQISVTSAPDEGTTFCLTLPARHR